MTEVEIIFLKMKNKSSYLLLLVISTFVILCQTDEADVVRTETQEF